MELEQVQGFHVLFSGKPWVLQTQEHAAYQGTRTSNILKTHIHKVYRSKGYPEPPYLPSGVYTDIMINYINISRDILTMYKHFAPTNTIWLFSNIAVLWVFGGIKCSCNFPISHGMMNITLCLKQWKINAHGKLAFRHDNTSHWYCIGDGSGYNQQETLEGSPLCCQAEKDSRAL